MDGPAYRRPQTPSRTMPDPSRSLPAPNAPGLWLTRWCEDSGRQRAAEVEIWRLGGRLVVLHGVVLRRGGWRTLYTELADHPGQEWSPNPA